MVRCLLLLLLLASTAAAAIPDAPAGPIELHGSLRCLGAAEGRYWARLLPADPQFNGHRMLQLVYQPPAPASLGGTVLVDCPFLLLDLQTRLVAWNGRQGLSRIDPAKGGGYAVVRERSVGEGVQEQAVGHDVQLAGPRAWDLRLAPLLLALAWRSDSSGRMRALDFFGPLPEATVSWQDTAVDLAGTAATITADPHGRLRRLVDAHGTALITVEDPPAP